ncbi:ABC transporter substrate-binding protein [Amphibiibacter pelophylacis]|uniref:Sugar ABC transporter substrate-binding protein n=1 Tax=Amphibiibacter pelophylacis TaxID=1799477 RepID=A0ACC6P3S1_9BURK
MTFRFKALIVATAALTASVGAWAQALPYNLKPGKPYNGQTVTVLAVETPQFQGLQLRDAEFTKMTGIKVQWNFTPFKALQEKITSVGAAKSDEFDVINFMDVWAPANSYWFTPLEAMAKRDGIDLKRYPQGFIDGSSYKGHLLGLPMRGHAQLFFYRKDIFEKLGIKPPTTWDDVAAAGRKIADAKLGVAPLACYYGADGNRQNLFIWANFLWGAGGEILDPASGKPAWNSPQGIKATEDYVGLMTKQKLCGDGAVSNTEQDARVSFAQGKTAMIPVWWWFYSAAINPKDSVLKPDQVGFVPMPAYNNRPAVTLVNVHSWALSSYSQHKDAAWEFLKWASNPDLEKKNAIEREVGGKTIVNNVVVQFPNMEDAEVNKANANVPAMGAKSLRISRELPMNTAWPEVGDALSKAVNNAAGGGDVKQLLDRAAKDSERALRRAAR